MWSSVKTAVVARTPPLAPKTFNHAALKYAPENELLSKPGKEYNYQRQERTAIEKLTAKGSGIKM